MKNLLKDTNGSVLMEFLLVCPLYFALLGGMLKIGSLSMTNHKIANYDSYAAIGYGKGIDIGTQLRTTFNLLFLEDGEYFKRSHVSLLDVDSDENIVGNKFIVQQSSGTEVNLISKPTLWSLLDSVYLFTDSQRTTPIQNTIAENYDRQVVIKVRNEKTKKELYDRSLPASKIAINGVWFNSTHDAFPMLNKRTQSMDKGEGGNAYERSTALCDFSE